jgi:hypothetical protein
MKALTIWQPWASLIMIGAKPFEFRGRSYARYPNHPRVNARIVIHAGARPVKREEITDLLARLDGPEDTTGLVAEKARALLLRVQEAHKCRLLPLAAGLGTAKLGLARNAGTIFGRANEAAGLYPPQDSDRGDFNWAWPLSDIEAFDSPIPARGMQGFWEWRTSSEPPVRITPLKRQNHHERIQ